MPLLVGDVTTSGPDLAPVGTGERGCVPGGGMGAPPPVRRNGNRKVRIGEKSEKRNRTSKDGRNSRGSQEKRELRFAKER